ncbi:MAG: stage II sporulation protein M [Anaerolineales bacterium]|nr:stage II sporulation protein M [Anaerolineales bacterium]
MAWITSYLLLPEGFLRGKSVSQIVSGYDLLGGSIYLEWLRIFAINLFILGIAIIAPNIFRNDKNIPLGYLTTEIISIIYAISIGTNSFSFTLGGKLPPSFDIFTTSGIYEIMAYVLGAAATFPLSKYRIVGKWPKQTIEKISDPMTKVDRIELIIGIIVSIIVLIISCGWEAYRISLVV